MPEDTTTQIANTFGEAINRIISFIPEMIAGILILIIGWIVAKFFSTLTRKGLKALNAERWLGEAGIKDDHQKQGWINTFSQVIFWTILIVFLIPAFEAWNLPVVTAVIGQLVGFLPNVIAAVIVGFLGFIVAKLAHQIIRKGTQKYGEDVSATLSNLARYSIIIFVTLVILRQLGIATTLVDIFFSALMFALALGIGLAFGLGGREPAGRLLSRLLERFRA
jgi:hypothetical protein